MPSQSDIRRNLRKRRDALSENDCQDAAFDLYQNVSQHPVYKRSKRIGFYYAKGNELNVSALLHLAWLQGKTTYLPVVTPRYLNKLWFLPYAPGNELKPNRYHIPEPQHAPQQRQFKPAQLDLLLMPLVGFDHNGNRIGMGAGYYDRTLAAMRTRKHWQKPFLMGIAYDLQEVDTIEQNNWDIPLHAVATNTKIITTRD